MDLQQLGKLLLIAGICVVVAGVALIAVGSTGLFDSLLRGGTIRIEGSGITCLIPIVASIFLSIVLTVVLNIVIRLINK